MNRNQKDAKKKSKRGTKQAAARTVPRVISTLGALASAVAHAQSEGAGYWPKQQEALAPGDHGIIVVGSTEAGAMLPGWVRIQERRGDECRIEVKARKIRKPGAAFEDLGQIDASTPEIRTASIRELLPITEQQFDEAMRGNASPSLDLMLGKDFDRRNGRWIATNYGMAPGIDVSVAIQGGGEIDARI